ncbi:MAG: hypothetical protein JXX29_16415 [Deltaproteobacteria bacterium]|nr:hypothetical protein [Deltaproteobacteria bacterium]MBN2673268.1 hypothetical protein [Deltaproteobacteria bacterium]
MKLILFISVAALLVGCSRDGSEGDNPNEVGYFEGEPQPVDGSCTSVRLTSYDADGGGWCEWRANHSFLPQFVQDGMHTAIAEPWNNSSFEGAVGESCGECWEVSTVNATGIVMVNNLCPIEGNPLCSGGHFHFDLSREAAAFLGGGGLDEASARRVPCPVEGGIHVQINDSNEWGYLRFAVLNHRIPVRSAAIASSADGPWVAAERSGGAMHVLEGPAPDESDGIYFQLTSTMGETLVAANSVPYMSGGGDAFDLGVQFEQVYEVVDCPFTPPGDVYWDEWGGIEGVVWQPNPWGDASSVTEVNSNCYNNSASCLDVSLDVWGGAHFYYRQAFPVATFSTAALRVFSQTAAQLIVAPSNNGERCSEQQASLAAGEWTLIEFDLATACAGFESLNGITIAGGGEQMSVTIDEIVFE